MARVLIGTFGWHYESWRGRFFPKGLPLKRQLDYYATKFATTELNGVFYRTPTEKAVTGWRDADADFVFAWKASKFIAHWKRLSENSVNSLELLEDGLSLLAQAGPILFQLPPNFPIDTERLASFLKLLKRRRRYAFEFRHPSGYEPRILKLLAARHRIVHFRSSRRAGALEADRRLCLHPRPWSWGTIQRALQAGRARQLGKAHPRPEAAGV